MKQRLVSMTCLCMSIFIFTWIMHPVCAATASLQAANGCHSAPDRACNSSRSSNAVRSTARFSVYLLGEWPHKLLGRRIQCANGDGRRLGRAAERRPRLRQGHLRQLLGGGEAITSAPWLPRREHLCAAMGRDGSYSIEQRSCGTADIPGSTLICS